MERKQSLDLDRTRIGRSLFGYNRAQVDEYLRYFREQALRTNARIRELEEQPQPLPASEKPIPPETTPEAIPAPIIEMVPTDPIHEKVGESFRQLFEAAHSIAEETRSNAEREAQIMLEEARVRTEEQIRDARSELSQLRWDIERLRLDKERMIAESGAPNGYSHPFVTPEELAALNAPDPEPHAS